MYKKFQHNLYILYVGSFYYYLIDKQLHRYDMYKK